MSEVTTERDGLDEFKNWQRKFLMHCLLVAKVTDAQTAIDSATGLEAIGEGLLYGLTDKVTRVLEKAKAEGKL